MKAIFVVLVLAGVVTSSGCDEAKKEVKKISNPMAQHMKALEAAKDVERQIFEVEANRQKLVEELANPGAH